MKDGKRARAVQGACELEPQHEPCVAGERNSVPAPMTDADPLSDVPTARPSIAMKPECVCTQAVRLSDAVISSQHSYDHPRTVS